MERINGMGIRGLWEIRCHTCGRPFYAKRADAECCSPKCRQARSRAIRRHTWQRHPDSKLGQ